jgi:spore germination protein
MLLWAGGSAATAPPSRAVSVWLPYWSMPAAETSALAHSSQIGTASPFWYAVSASGTVTDDPGAGNPSLVDALRSRGVAVVPTVSETAGLDAFDQMLASARRRAAVVSALVGIVRSGAYAGLDLDFEQFAVDPDDNQAAADAAATGYPAFVGEACRALHAIGRTCTVTVMARTSSAHVLWRGHLATWVYDYAALGAVADRVRIMAYDDHAPDTAAGPIAPYRWVEQVVAYARAELQPAKAELGIAAFGYTWNPASRPGSPASPGAGATHPNSGNTFAAAQAGALAAAHDATPAWSATAGEERLRYGTAGQATIAWYEDARAELMRARLAIEAGFAGVVLWAAGDETPSFWAGMASA